MFSVFNTSSDHISAVFDIGNGSIGVALVKFEKGQLPTIIYTYREPITFLPKPVSSRLLGAMYKLLKSVSVHLEKNGFKYLPASPFGRHRIHTVHCVFASPWYFSETNVIKVSEEKPFVITQNLIDTTLEKAEKPTDESWRNYEKIFGTDTEDIEKKLVHTKLNGYEVADPIGKKAREFEMTFFRSVVSKAVLTKVEEIIQSSFHFKTIGFSSYALSSWGALREIFPAVDDFLFLDVSAETTDVAITLKGVLLGVESFPLGRAMLLRALVKNLEVTPEIALSFLDMHSKENSEPAFSKKIGAIFKEASTEWVAEFQEVLKKIQQKYPLPKNLFITVDEDVSSIFTAALGNINSPELSIPQNTFHILYLGGQIFKNHNRYLTVLAPDPFLSIESIFLGKILT